ncbi:MAG TPA: AmmeMemoRadiSam system protein B, partial [Verrucomicrobiae bacterium]|nr:AmmeMemoRadiSam system protein B [Verrucomicrobiae bacterium]
YVPIEGLAASDAEAFATPLGLVPVDSEAVHRICSLPQVSILESAHGEEHSLEVQLPFLQVVLGEFKIVPLVVGDATEAQVAEVIEMLWDGPSTRIVVSSDLSHYFSDGDARRLDEATRCAIEEGRVEDISELQACGRTAICGLLRVARQAGLRARALDLRNSGDTAGPRDTVVGYGAFVIEETPPQS